MDRRKELKLAYKQNPPPAGVYQLKNNVTGKIFIGSSLNLPGSFNRHRFQLQAKTHPSQDLQRAWDHDGPEAFNFEVLATIDTAKLAEGDWHDAVTALEQQWLEKLQPYAAKGYNLRKN
ncbi:MAG: GIY-YIG nuclease family protein [Peptococcaceae bacterium]|nr:GIY-YIG nuclease family protein [Peptococcaceae bacterium]